MNDVTDIVVNAADITDAMTRLLACQVGIDLFDDEWKSAEGQTYYEWAEGWKLDTIEQFDAAIESALESGDGQ